ncbi:hypothetical protein [Nocardia wallacei]|uniref:hypothetical protein n=1 Tax=Nocardia wallacei TaxID=480035 RepID=UPI002458F2D6|nr:hypothetical protein [Nocardia wallacei]
MSDDPIDVAAILASIPEVELEPDPWGGANLAALGSEDYEDVPLVRKHADE